LADAPGGGTARIVVRLTPRGGGDRLDGWASDAAGRSFLKVRVSAPPVDGEANLALERLLARALGASRSAVAIVAGATARLKQVEIAGMDQQEAEARLGRPPG
jgi:uncharacterized protein YggU (UPF0235/DUF167 family)